MVHGFGFTLHQNLQLGESALGYSLIIFEGRSSLLFFKTMDSDKSVSFHSAIAESVL